METEGKRALLKAYLRSRQLATDISVPVDIWVSIDTRRDEWADICRNMCAWYEVEHGEPDTDSVFARWLTAERNRTHPRTHQGRG